MLRIRHIAALLVILVGSLALQAQDENKGNKKDRNHQGWNKFSPTLDYFFRAKGGFGLTYGMWGANGELGYEYGSFYMGVGYYHLKNIRNEIAFNIGFRGYFWKTEKKLRIRGSAGYGVNGIYRENDTQTVALGYNVGAGMEHRITDKLIYDMDLIIPLNFSNSNRPVNRELELIAFPSIGFGYYF